MESCLVSADTSSGGGSGGSTAPTVQSVTPANSATSIAVGDNITVTFSEAMQSSTIDNSTVTLTSSGSNVTSTVSYSSNVATINPNVVDDGLLWNTQYTINVSTGVKDTAGNALTNAYTSSFTTAVLPIPTNVTATALSATSIRVDWDAMPGAPKYNNNRGTSSTSFTSSSSPSTNTYTWNGLTASTTYYFRVRSINNGIGANYQKSNWATVINTTTN